MKVSELTGEKLALWAGKALGYELVSGLAVIGEAAIGMRLPVLFYSDAGVLSAAGKGIGGPWRPHEDWAQGGPIIDHARMNFATIGTGPVGEHGKAPIVAIPEDGRKAMEGPTHLVAAMRAHIASEYGDEVPD